MKQPCYQLLLFLVLYIREISCCNSQTTSSDDGCWYTFWYVWLAIGLFLLVLITIVIVYCKHKTKRRNRVTRIQGARPLNPPEYTAPSHQPPAYDVAIKESVVVPSNFHGDIRHIRAMQNRMEHERNLERAYYERTLNVQRQVSDVSVISYPPSYIDDAQRQQNNGAQRQQNRR